MNNDSAVDVAAEVRRAKFGKLPERIRLEDMSEVRQVPSGTGLGTAYNPEGSWQHFSCLAMDLGL
ncbi:hypothetical protein [Streptomyces sp. NPDC003393]